MTLLPVMTPKFKSLKLVASTSVASLADGNNTFSSLSFGTPASGRRLILAIATISFAGQSLNSVTIGGVTATARVARGGGAHSLNGYSYVFDATVPTGASGDIVLNISTTFDLTSLSLFRAIGLKTAGAYHTNANENTGSITVNVPANGFIIAAKASINTTSMTWTGLTRERNDHAGSNESTSTAYSALMAAQTGYTVTTTSTDNNAQVIASFG